MQAIDPVLAYIWVQEQAMLEAGGDHAILGLCRQRCIADMQQTWQPCHAGRRLATALIPSRNTRGCSHAGGSTAINTRAGKEKTRNCGRLHENDERK